MSPRSTTRLLAQSGRIILRWSDTPSAPALEWPVELVDSDDPDPVVRAPRRVGEDTPVTLVAEGYMVNGIVTFCRADKDSYLITVSISEISENQLETAHFHDPGAFAVDDFLTEEEEAKILESLQDSFRSQTSEFAAVSNACRELLAFVRPLVAAFFCAMRCAKELPKFTPAGLAVHSLTGVRATCC
jgi:hypothetical protein